MKEQMVRLKPSNSTYIRIRKFQFRNPLFAATTLGMLSSNAYSSFAAHGLQERYPYDPPSWAKGILTNNPSNGRLNLANLPTPLHLVRANNASEKGEQNMNNKRQKVSTSFPLFNKLDKMGISFYVKRDDMSGGVETGGNKIRKLEFLLADATEKEYDSVVTIGGEQSNHCRATAAACRMVGLEPHLILRTKRAKVISDDDDNSNRKDDDSSNFGFTGNILYDRMVGSTIYTCTPGEYGRIGSEQLVKRVCGHLKTNHDKKVYPIPVGGSNGLGSWGYINGVEELLSQWQHIYNDETNKTIDHIVFACGSGGTAAGIVLGIALAYRQQKDEKCPKVHAIGVCDDPDYFYKFVAKIADEMGFQLPGTTTEEFIREHMIVYQGKGSGYAISTPEELDFITQFSLETGIVLDPVYSGKALYSFYKDAILPAPDENNASDNIFCEGQNVIFWHTGGALGLFDKGNDLLDTMDKISPIKRLDVYGKNTKPKNSIVDIQKSE